MILEIFFPLLFYLNTLQNQKELYQNKKTFEFYNPQELETTEKQLQIKGLVSDITQMYFLGKDKEAYNKTQELAKYKEAESYYNYFLAVWESKQENHLKAQVLLSQALNLNPELDPAWNLLGYLQSLAGDYTNAVESFKKAISLYPYHPIYRYNLARTYWLLQKNDLALTEINTCINLRDNFPDAYYLKGLLIENSNPEEAIKNYNEALERNFTEEDFIKRFLSLSIKHNKKESILKILKATDNVNNQELNLIRFELFVQYGEINKAFTEFSKIMLNGFFTTEEFRNHQKILEKAYIFSCNYKKELQSFLQKNYKNLQEYKIKLIENILTQPCKTPPKAKDPLINPAL
jgi:tetratricopeptide (TPR) repeat protein